MRAGMMGVYIYIYVLTWVRVFHYRSVWSCRRPSSRCTPLRGSPQNSSAFILWGANNLPPNRASSSSFEGWNSVSYPSRTRRILMLCSGYCLSHSVKASFAGEAFACVTFSTLLRWTCFGVVALVMLRVRAIVL